MPLALLTLLVTVAYIPGLPSNAAVGRWVLVAVGSAVLLWQVRVRWTPGHLAGSALLLWCAAGLVWAVSGWDAAGELLRLLGLAAAFMVAAEEDSLDRVWVALALGVTVSAGFTVVQALGWSPVWNVDPGQHPVGLFLTKNMATEAAVLAVIGAVGAGRLGWLLLPGPLLVLYLVPSRAAILALAAAAMAWLWTSHPRHRLVVLYVGSVIAAVLVATAVRSLSGGGDRLVFLADRWEIWSAAARNLTVMGHGLGSFSVAFTGYEFAHNEFLHYGFELGVGLLFLIGVLGYGITADRPREQVAMAAVLVMACFWFPLHSPLTAFMAAVLAGHLCGARYRRVRPEPARRVHHPDRADHTGPLGIGALQPADGGRADLSLRPQHQMGSRAVCGQARPFGSGETA